MNSVFALVNLVVLRRDLLANLLSFYERPPTVTILNGN